MIFFRFLSFLLLLVAMMACGGKSESPPIAQSILALSPCMVGEVVLSTRLVSSDATGLSEPVWHDSTRLVVISRLPEHTIGVQVLPELPAGLLPNWGVAYAREYDPAGPIIGLDFAISSPLDPDDEGKMWVVDPNPSPVMPDWINPYWRFTSSTPGLRFYVRVLECS